MMKEIKSKLEFKAIFVMLHCYKSHPDKNIRESLVHTTLRKHCHLQFLSKNIIVQITVNFTGQALYCPSITYKAEVLAMV